MGKKEELEKQLEELKEKLREERKKERIKKISQYRRERYKQKVFYIPKEIEDKDYYIFLKLAKKLGIKTFKRGWEIYYVDKELERLEEQRNKDEE